MVDKIEIKNKVMLTRLWNKSTRIMDIFEYMIPLEDRHKFYGNFYIAGGAIYSLYNNLEVADYDVFFKYQEIPIAIKTYLLANGKNIKSVKEGAVYIGNYDGIKFIITQNGITFGKFQLIIKWHGDIEDVVGSFDIKNNQYYYDYKENKIFGLVEESYLKTNKLSFNEERQRDLANILCRIPKYTKKGYIVTKSEILKMLNMIYSNGYDIVGELDELNGLVYNDGY